jgi:hypothetical protein
MGSVVVSRTRRLGIPAMVWVAACGDPAAQVTIVPIGGACGKPTGANLVKVIAYGAHGERSESIALDESIAIADFPADTEQLGVEVLVGGGDIGAAGKSAPFGSAGFAGLADRTTIPIFMGPPDGFCEVGAMLEARAQPLVARAGDGVLVVGGIGATGPLLSAEYFDPQALAFSHVAVPQGLGDPQGLTGAALATLDDGRVAVLGGPEHVLLVFDPASRRFTIGPVLIAPRAFHAAIAAGAQDVVVAGGCFTVAGGQCSGVPIHQVQRYHVDRIGDPDTAGLPATNGVRIGAQLFDLGVQLDGHRRYLLAGGRGDPGLADRFELADEQATVLAGGHAQPAALDGGAVLTAFADDASPADGAAAIYAPDASQAYAIASAPEAPGMRLIALEDGRVAGFGGDPTHDLARVVTYDPTRDAWTPGADQPDLLTAPALVRLADGSILVLGGAVSARAWLYRPSLVGPAAGTVTAAPTMDGVRGVLTAPDPATVTRTDRGQPAYVLTAPGEALSARALVGGLRTATGSVSAVVHVLAGGVALIAQQDAPGHAIVAELAPGAAPRLIQLEAGMARAICAGAPMPAFDPALGASVRLAISGQDARLTIDQREVLACSVAATVRGAWGVAALGAGARVAVDSVTVAR